MLRTLCAFSILAPASGAALAHPGHGTIAASIAQWLHLLLSPDHLLGTIAAVLLALGLLVAAAVGRSRRERRHDSR